MEIIWTPQALKDYWDNIDYLLEDFTVNEAQYFISQAEYYIKIIQQKPKAFRKTNYKNTHAVPIVPQITLYYRENKKSIELLSFFNNFQDPKKIKERM
jgi:plasmid stabilization system protein ParE